MVELLFALLTTMTGIERTQDAGLTAIAQRRAVEIQSSFSHSGWVYGRDGEAEIIAWTNAADPATALALQWQASPPHWAILTDPRFTRWGCAISQAGTAFYGVCLFGSGGAVITQGPLEPNSPVIAPAPIVPAPTTEPTVLLPNTAQEKSMNEWVQILVLASILGLLIVTPWGRERRGGARTFPDPVDEPPAVVTPRAPKESP